MVYYKDKKNQQQSFKKKPREENTREQGVLERMNLFAEALEKETGSLTNEKAVVEVFENFEEFLIHLKDSEYKAVDVPQPSFTGIEQQIFDAFGGEMSQGKTEGQEFSSWSVFRQLINSSADDLRQVIQDQFEKRAGFVGKNVDELSIRQIRAIAYLLASKYIPGENVRPENALGPEIAISQVFIAIAFLFLMGAASKNTPDALRVLIPMFPGVRANYTYPFFVFYKYELRQAYSHVTHGSTSIRSLAEKLARFIGIVAVFFGLPGDLALQFERELALQNQPPLDKLERAWCSSFSSTIPVEELNRYTGSTRVSEFLIRDGQRRFKSKKKEGKKG